MFLDRCSSGFVEGDQAPRGTMMHLAQKHRANFRIVGVGDLFPYFSVRVAEPAVRAQVLCIQKGKDRAVEYGSPRGIGRALRSFGAIKADFCVGAVTERRSMCVATSAQRVFCRSIVRLALLPFQ